MALILDGKKVRAECERKLTERIKAASLKLCLAIVQVGDRPESNSFIAQKVRCAETLGASVFHLKLSENISHEALEAEINSLNKDRSVTGIILQLPLPPHLSSECVDYIDPDKDVDGLTGKNTNYLIEGSDKGFIPATALGIRTLLQAYQIPISGKKVVIVGRSKLVGTPVALLMLSEGATVTVCHKKTKDLSQETREADILIVAAGSPGLITKESVSKGQTIVDVGITLEDQAGLRVLKGDVLFADVEPIVDAITPVPGGVGPMTVISLFENLVKSSEEYTRKLQ